MEYELQFLIMVNCDFEKDRLLNVLRGSWSDANWVRHSSFDIAQNWVQVSENEDFDPEQSKDPEDGFLFFRYRFEVSPVKGVKDLKAQVALAKSLKSRLESIGCTAEIVADFEELL